MKKILVLFITATMVLSMSACSGDNTVTDTNSVSDAVDLTTTNDEVVYVAESEIDNIIAGVETEVMETADDYETVLKDMGFGEVDLDLHRIMKADGTLGAPTTTVKNITYNDDVFRMELSTFDQDLNTETDGWVLYGIKATEIADISGFDPEECDFYDVFNMADGFPEYKEYSAEYVNYTYYYGENGYTEVKAVFFPETGNLYNLVNSYDSYPENGVASPSVIWRKEQFE